MSYSLAPAFITSIGLGSDLQRSHTPKIEDEAIKVNLGNGRSVFALVGGRMMPGRFSSVASFDTGYLAGMPNRPFGRAGFGYPQIVTGERAYALERIRWAHAHKGMALTLDCEPDLQKNPTGECPAFAEVGLPPQSASVRLLDAERLQDTFGDGVTLKSVTLTIVQDPVTHEIRKPLPWVEEAPNNQIRTAGFRSNEEKMKRLGFIRND